MGNKEIDDAILAASSQEWLKVTMVILRTKEALRLPEKWAIPQVAKRIRTLARKGELELAGNPYNGRRSEVRRPLRSNV